MMRGSLSAPYHLARESGGTVLVNGSERPQVSSRKHHTLVVTCAVILKLMPL